jgi:hypothetical protein
MNRRAFIRTTSSASALWIAGEILPGNNSQLKYNTEMPWYRVAMRWGQTNITEKDPRHYDINWWRRHWKETAIQGVIINAGGIFAYYPSSVPHHRQAEFLDGKDLFGELCRAAHEDGLAVFARLDSNRAHEDCYKAHPDWFAVNEEGEPYRAGEMYITCVNGPYYNEHIPSIINEIASLYKPEGFTDNSWSGLGRDSICCCENCKKSFYAKTGHQLPKAADWESREYREWIKWNYGRRLEIWDLNNRVAKKAGGPASIWSGMNSGSLEWQSESFRDLKEICKRAEIIMLDSQARNDAGGFQQNADTGKLIHGLLGWDKLIPESMAMYQAGQPTFRMAAKPPAEARMWMIEGIAGGIQPWWHYVGASHDDRRIYNTPAPVFQWHRENERYLVNRKPVATAGVVWSQDNIDFYGRDDSGQVVEQPRRGIVQALIRARIPYIPVHADHIDREAGALSLLILPNTGAMTDEQIQAVTRFSEKGGAVFATGDTSLYDNWGDRREDFGLAELFGVHAHSAGKRQKEAPGKRFQDTLHTYLRLIPGMKDKADGPSDGQASAASGPRHPILSGFDETDIIAFGGKLEAYSTDITAGVLATYVPPFPIYPPETAWMREPVTNIPGLIVNTLPGRGRIVFMPADIDRQFALYNLPDHGNLLANIIRWCLGDNVPLTVECPGLLDVNLYRKKESLILHIVNLTSAGTWRQPVDEYIPVGPVKCSVKLPSELKAMSVKLLVSGKNLSPAVERSVCTFSIDSITDHEVVFIA